MYGASLLLRISHPNVSSLSLVEVEASSLVVRREDELRVKFLEMGELGGGELVALMDSEEKISDGSGDGEAEEFVELLRESSFLGPSSK